MTYCVEFEKHCSPHIHGLLWIEDAPKYGQHKNEDLHAHNDKIISYSTDVCEEEQQYVLLQKHKHSKTGMKVSNGKKICQFGGSWSPMCVTIILELLPFDENAQHEMYV